MLRCSGGSRTRPAQLSARGHARASQSPDGLAGNAHEANVTGTGREALARRMAEMSQILESPGMSISPTPTEALAAKTVLQALVPDQLVNGVTAVL